MAAFFDFIPEGVYCVGCLFSLPYSGDTMPNPLSRFVKQRRKLLGLTQVDLADRAGVGLRFVRDLEQGKQTLRLDKANQVLAMFGHVLAPVKDEEERNGGS